MIIIAQSSSPDTRWLSDCEKGVLDQERAQLAYQMNPSHVGHLLFEQKMPVQEDSPPPKLCLGPVWISVSSFRTKDYYNPGTGKAGSIVLSAKH